MTDVSERNINKVNYLKYPVINENDRNICLIFFFKINLLLIIIAATKDLSYNKFSIVSTSYQDRTELSQQKGFIVSDDPV